MDRTSVSLPDCRHDAKTAARKGHRFSHRSGAREPSAAEAPDDRHRRDVLAGEAAEVVRQPEHGIAELPCAGVAPELEVHLVEHPQPGRADRVTEALEPPVDLAGHLAGGIVEA